jgi:TonB family protein
MRKTSIETLFPCCIGLLCLIASGLPSQPATAQNAAPAPAKAAPVAPVATDGKALMLLAAKSNGLTGPDIQPWHAKASFKFFDEKGNVTDEGTYEELWVSRTKFKLSFTEKSFTHTEFGTSKGILLSGNPAQSIELESFVRSEFADPLPSLKTVQGEKFALTPTQLGAIKFSCLRQTNANAEPIGPNWCLDPEKPILLIDNIPGGQHVIHSKTLSFQDRFVAGDLRFVSNGKAILTAHLDSLEPLGPIDEADFAPPADAAPWTPIVVLSPDIAQTLLTVKVAPDYPVAAQKQDVKGKVMMKATIGKDGKVTDLQVVSGPDMLRDAAMDAVRQWVFEPYRVNGEPVRARTWIVVGFPN